MALFSYRAINDDSKEVRGQVEATDLDAAKSALEEQHLDVIELNEARRSRSVDAPAAPLSVEQPVLKTTFAFEGTDAAGTIRRGTIQSESKYQAFERLKQDQNLLVAMLSPLGVTPQYRDSDLENWQRAEVAAPAPPPPLPTQTKQEAPPPTSVAPVAKKVGFSSPVPKTPPAPPPAAPSVQPKAYHPLAATLRLYAGWLLAWYGLFVALGYYATYRTLPWEIPFVQAFFVSPLIFDFIVATFLFLMLSHAHRVLHGKMISAVVLIVIGVSAVAAVHL